MGHKARHALALLVTTLMAGAAHAQQEEDIDRPRTLPTHISSFWADFTRVWAAGAANERIRLEYENDLFFNTDHFYTDGVRLTLRRGTGIASKLDADESGQLVPPLHVRLLPGQKAGALADDPACAHAAHDEREHKEGLAQAKDGENPRPYCYRSAYNVVIGHNMYTPSDIRLPSSQIPASDRPYAAWAYVGFQREVYSSDDRYWRYGVDIGCLGPCARGRQLQTWIHKNVTDSPLPGGWDSQIRDEYGFVLRYEHAWRAWRIGPRRETQNRPAGFGESVFGAPFAADLRPAVDIGLGNIQTYAGVGVTGRIGWFRSGYDTMRLDTHPIESLARGGSGEGGDGGDMRRLPQIYAQTEGATRTDLSYNTQDAPAAAPTRLKPAPEMFAFARLHSNLVAYNAMLQGGMFNNSSPKTAPARPFILEREVGIAAAYGAFSLSVSAVMRREWQTSGATFGQRFGRITLEFGKRF